MSEKLYVVTCISNPQQYKSRYRLYREFKEYMSTHENVEFYTVELSFRDRPFEVTTADDPYSIQVYSDQEYWHKEVLLNIGISRLPREAKKIAWVDADVRFMSPTWVKDTLDSLDHYDFVQMFSEYMDLGPKNEAMGTMTSFIKAWTEGKEQIVDAVYGCGRKGATGLAWAARKDALDKVGGLMDFHILGASDFEMAYAFIGKGMEIARDWITPGYRTLLQKFQDACDNYICENVGYVPGLAVHYWHGPKSKRGYGWRCNILKENNFDPIMDLKRDFQGLYIINPEKRKMISQMREYFMSRDEDTLSLI